MPPDALHDPVPRSVPRKGPNEAEFERTPEAEAGRAQIEQCLHRFSADERTAFWEAVARCYASAVTPDD